MTEHKIQPIEIKMRGGRTVKQELPHTLQRVTVAKPVENFTHGERLVYGAKLSVQIWKLYKNKASRIEITKRIFQLGKDVVWPVIQSVLAKRSK